jgi:hypothetical protein
MKTKSQYFYSMKKILLLALLGLSTFAKAEPLQNCLVLMNGTGQNASTTGSIIPFVARNISAMSVVTTANNVSGTTPTLDIIIDSCRTSAGTCKSWFVQSQCTTGSCWVDGFDVDDLNSTNVNWFQFFRVRTTLGGTSPVYNVRVELCYTS